MSDVRPSGLSLTGSSGRSGSQLLAAYRNTSDERRGERLRLPTVSLSALCSIGCSIKRKAAFSSFRRIPHAPGTVTSVVSRGCDARGGTGLLFKACSCGRASETERRSLLSARMTYGALRVGVLHATGTAYETMHPEWDIQRMCIIGRAAPPWLLDERLLFAAWRLR